MTIFKKTIVYLVLITGIITSGSFLTIIPKAEAADCSIVSATFDPYTEKLGLAQDGWFRRAVRNTKNLVKIHIKTSDCANETISVSLTGYKDSLSVVTEDVDVLNDRDYIVPVSEEFDINLIAGEEGCKLNILPWNAGIAGTADCQFHISISTGLASLNYSSRDKERGNLDFECEGGCNESDEGDVKWLYAGDTSDQPSEPDPGSIPPKNTTTLSDNITGNVSPKCMGTDGNPIEGCYQLYSGFEEILTKVGFKNMNSIGDFINALIALGIGIAGVITVGMIMWDGFTYWRAGKTGNEIKLGEVKGRIWKRLLGLLLLFTIYTLLRTINPDLLNLTPRIDAVALKLSSQSALSPNDFATITGEPLKSPSEYDALAKQVATTFSSDYCALRVIIQNESRGNANVVGQDENVRDPGIPSRVAFINSGKKYSGTTFAKSGDLITQKGFCNDAAGCVGGVPKPNDATLGLDWRFTKGIGLTQITFFPNDYKDFKTPGYVPFYDNKNIPPKRTFNFSSGTMTVTPFEAFKPEKNLEIAAKLWKQGMATCNNSPQGAFYTYACGACDCSGNNFAKTEVSERVSQYNECKKQNP